MKESTRQKSPVLDDDDEDDEDADDDDTDRQTVAVLHL